MMSTQTGKRVAQIKLTLNKRSVDALKPADKPFIAWDDRLTGFGVRVQPSGVRSYLVNYRASGGGRRAANRRLVIGRHGRVSAEQARRIAQETLGKAAAGEDPAEGRTRSRSTPTLREAFEEFLAAGPERKPRTVEVYRRTVYHDLAPWLDRSLNTISRRDVEQCFNRLTTEIGWVGANSALTMLGALYRRQCVDVQGLHNPVAQWRAAGGRLHRQRRRRIQPPAEVLPRWHRGIEKGVRNPVARDALRLGLYTGMRHSEVLELRWDMVDLDAMTLVVEETKTGEPLEIPIVRQVAAILERRMAERGNYPQTSRPWVFPSEISASGRLVTTQQLNARIGEVGGAKFWFHALRNCFITVADRELMLPTSVTKRLVNHARPRDLTEGYASDWTADQLRVAAQRIADRIDELIEC
ncbi:MAG: integrase arm-type DNA-binding domain-containing protein [Defluviicoccus sp.]|nr:integrase arm-type DNA-binding domain-containing protein [Defluviicoccus sp.]